MVVRTPCRFQGPKHASPRPRPLHPSRGRDWRSTAGVVRSLKVPTSAQSTVVVEETSRRGLGATLTGSSYMDGSDRTSWAPRDFFLGPSPSLCDNPPLAQTAQIRQVQDNQSERRHRETERDRDCRIRANHRTLSLLWGSTRTRPRRHLGSRTHPRGGKGPRRSGLAV